MTSHIAHQHSYLDQALQCNTCLEQFTDRYSYNVHRRIHAKVKKPRSSKRIAEPDVVLDKSKAKKRKIKVVPKKPSKVKNKSSRRRVLKMRNCDKCHKKHLEPCGKSPEVVYNCDSCRKSFKRLKNFQKHKCLQNPEADQFEVNEDEDTFYEEVEDKIFFKITSFRDPDNVIVDCLEVQLNENPKDKPKMDFNDNLRQPLDDQNQVEEEQPAIEYDNVEEEEMGWLSDVLDTL